MLEQTMELKYEAFLLFHFSHPNIVQLYGEGSIILPNGTVVFYIVVEKLAETLQQRLVRCTGRNIKRNIDNMLPTLVSLANTLSYLHEADASTIYVHRDIKPDNIGYTVDGVLKIFDFGLSGNFPRPAHGKSSLRSPPNANAEASHSISSNNSSLAVAVHATSSPMQIGLSGVKGSVRYMAPEVAMGQVYDEAIDVYSFALVMWESLHGKKPYLGLDVATHSRVVCQNGGRPDIDSAMPAPLADTMHNAWNRHPSKRSTMGDIGLKLQKYLEERGAANTQSSVFPVRRNFSGFFSFGRSASTPPTPMESGE